MNWRNWLSIICVMFVFSLWFAACNNTVTDPTQRQSQSSLKLPDDLSNKATEEDAAKFAWETFIAISQKGSYAESGIPLSGEKFGADGPTVWETWVEAFDLFHNPLEPPKWEDPNRIPQTCAELGDDMSKVIHQASKVSDLLDERNQAVGGPILDVNGNLARYEVRLNQALFDFIIQNKLYRADKQATFPENKFRFPNGSIEIKASWKVMTENDKPERFHIAETLIYDQEADTPGNPDFLPPGTKDPKCRKQKMGLVGLHVVYRVPSAPSSVWMTFEQIDNTDDTPEGQTPSFYKPDCPVEDCPPNTRFSDDPDQKFTQITRFKKIDDVINKVNSTMQESEPVKGTKWQNYKLVGIQYPTNPDFDRVGKPNTQRLANTTMETFNQSASSCVGCHAFARSSNPTKLGDFSWMISRAKVPSNFELDANSTAEDVVFYITRVNPYATWGTWPDDKWNVFSEIMSGENPHGKSVRLYVNEIARKYAIGPDGKPKTGIEPILPVGSILVKENYNVPFPAKVNPGNLVEITIMYKQPGADGPNGWTWIKTNPFGTRIDNRGNDESCSSCHKWQDNGDFMVLFNFGKEPVIQTRRLDERLKKEFEQKKSKE